MAFNTENELKEFLLEKCKIAIAETQMAVYQDIMNRANAFYDDYDPILYDRTKQLNNNDGRSENFIVKSPVISSGNHCEASVCLDVDSLNYVTGKPPSGEQVVSAAVSGLHGANGLRVMSGNTGVKLWDGQFDENAQIALKQALIAQGLDIR